MADLDHVRRIALALPETEEHSSWGQPTWKVRNKGFVWERPLRAKDRQALGAAAPEGLVLGAAVADLGVKEALLETGPQLFFTTPHFDGYAAVLVRLDAIGPEELEEVVVDAWLARAPKRVAADYLAAQ